MKRYYESADLEQSFEQCIQWNNFSADVFIAILRNNAEISQQDYLNLHHQNPDAEEPDLKRQLSYYEQLY